jgi:hypothetical protein
MHATANEKEAARERVTAVAGWLVEGKLRPECVAAAMSEWQVSRRTAQVYVARAAARIAKATTFEDPLFALKFSQVQRDKVFQELQTLLRDGQLLELPHWKLKLQTLQATLRMLDSRDRTAARLLQLQRTEAPPPKTLRRDPPPPPPPTPPRPDASLRASGITPPPTPAPKTLRPEPARPPAPQRPDLTPQELDRAAAAILRVPKQATESVSILPKPPNEKPRQEMQRAVGPDATSVVSGSTVRCVASASILHFPR